MNKRNNNIKMLPELCGLKGGEKQQWLRTHRKEVQQYATDNGDDAARARFNCSRHTWSRFQHREYKDIALTKLTEADKWVFHELQERRRDDMDRVAKLEAWRKDSEPVISFGRAIMSSVNFQLEQLQSQKVSPTLESGEPFQLGEKLTR